jgi:general secretion pathway protein C
MDVAKRRLAQWKEQSPEQWLASANRYLPPGVTAILVLAVAYQLANLTWSVVPGSAGAAVLPVATAPVPGAAPADSPSDFTTLLAAHLFGEAPAGEAAPVIQETVVDAPDTTLSLELRGVLSGADSAVIASNRGQDRHYHVGQQIENANGATLHSVHEDRVLLNRGDRLEALKLPKLSETGAPAPQRAGGPFLAPAAAPPAQNTSLRQVISQNATRLTEIIRVSPHVEEGNVVGFRVTPGRNRETFEALGFKSGDVVTDINGTQLNDAGNGIQVFESLGESTMANVTVLREGVPTVIVIDTSQLQNMQEGRE